MMGSEKIVLLVYILGVALSMSLFMTLFTLEQEETDKKQKNDPVILTFFYFCTGILWTGIMSWFGVGIMIAGIIDNLKRYFKK